MLTKVYIDNFKSLVNFEFKPGPIQLILGDNGSGKSSFIEAIGRLRNFLLEGVDVGLEFGKSSLTRWDSRTVQTFEMTVEGNGGAYVYRLEIEQHRGSLAAEVALESLFFEGRPLFFSRQGEDRFFRDDGGEASRRPSKSPQSGLFSVALQDENTKLHWFKTWIDSLCCVVADSEMRPERVGENRWPNERFTNFAQWLERQGAEDPHGVDELLAALKSGAIEGFETMASIGAGRAIQELGVEFQAGPEGDEKARLSFKEWELSDGQRVLIKLYALAFCAMKPGSTLILDDPVVHVSLREIQPWLTTLLDRADDIDAQVLLISHHPELINYLARENGIFFERAGNGPVKVRPAHFDENEPLPPAELVARGWIDG